MANTRSVIFGQVFDHVLQTVSKPNVPVSSGAERAVAQAVTEKLAPVLVNLTNSEPWYRSRIFLGLLTAALGFLLSKLGLVVSEGDIAELANIIAAIMESGGLSYAWYGRIVGARKPALGA